MQVRSMDQEVRSEIRVPVTVVAFASGLAVAILATVLLAPFSIF